MDLSLKPEHEAFRQSIKDFIGQYGDRAAGAIPGQRPGPKQLAWQALVLEHGFAGRFVPREYGGFGAPYDIMEQRLIVEEFSRAGIPAGIGNQGISMLVPTLLDLGSEQQKRDYIAPTLRGEMVWCQGYSEPNAGSDLAALQTKGVEDGDDFIVNGQKIWTSTAHEADMIFCLVRTEPDASKHAGISYLLFSMDDPGIVIRPLKTMSGRSEFNEVFFTDVRVPKTQMLGARGEGWKVANATLSHERAYLANSALLSQRYAELNQLLQQETVNGDPVTQDPMLIDRLMRLQSRLLALKCHDLKLLTHSIRGENPGIAGLITKLYGTETRYQIDVLALDAQGEYGLLKQQDPDVRAEGQWYEREALDLGLIIGGGTAQIQKNIIAERGLGMPREPKLAKEGA
jgi:alkylation response protein AidB-like acyl-CoA dehydrogenase